MPDVIECKGCALRTTVLQAFAMAEAFVEIRAQRRSRLSRSPT